MLSGVFPQRTNKQESLKAERRGDSSGSAMLDDISLRCWGWSLSRPPADPLGKEFMAARMSLAETWKEKSWGLGGGGSSVSGEGNGCLVWRAARVSSLKSANKSFELARRMASLMSPASIFFDTRWDKWDWEVSDWDESGGYFLVYVTLRWRRLFMSKLVLILSWQRLRPTHITGNSETSWRKVEESVPSSSRMSGDDFVENCCKTSCCTGVGLHLVFSQSLWLTEHSGKCQAQGQPAESLWLVCWREHVEALVQLLSMEGLKMSQGLGGFLNPGNEGVEDHGP